MPGVRKEFEVSSSDKKNLDNLCDSEKGLMGTVGTISAILNKEAEESPNNGGAAGIVSTQEMR